jgi:hypothetical protein
MVDRPTEAQIRQLHEQLVASRVQWREDFAREKRELEALRKDVHVEATQVRTEAKKAREEREHLRKLRQRFLAKWKRDWGRERALLQTEKQHLAEAQHRLDQDRIAFRDQSESELQRISRESAQLQADKIAWQQKQSAEEAQLQRDRRQLVDQQESFSRRVDEVQKQHDQQIKKLERTRLELQGLESRTGHLRHVLAEMEKQREQWLDGGPNAVSTESISDRLKELSGAIHESVLLIRSPGSDKEREIEARKQRLEYLAQQLLDQRAYLVEHVNRLSIAKEIWRAEERRMLEEVESIAFEIREREESTRPREKMMQQKELDLQRRSFQLAQRQRDIELGRSRLAAGEASWKSQRDRLEIEHQQQKKRNEQLRIDLDTLLKEVASKHRQGKHDLHERLDQLKNWLDRWQQSVKELADAKDRIGKRERELDIEHASLEQVRFDLERHAKREVVTKRVERYTRRIAGSFRRQGQWLEQQQLKLKESLTPMEKMIRGVQDELPSLLKVQHELLEKEVTLLAQAKSANRQLVEAASYAEQFKLTQSRYEQQVIDMQAEINRLQEQFEGEEPAEPKFTLRAA